MPRPPSSPARRADSAKRSRAACTPTATASCSLTSTSKGVERLAARARRPGAPVEHDVRELDSWERLLAAAGEVDVLVNNAARTELRSFWEIELDEWDDVLATNLRGTYLGCRVVGAQMRDRGRGRIVNLASVAGQAGRAATGVHYATSKAAIVALTRLAATELAGSGVTVNAIAPAAIDGPMVHDACRRDRIDGDGGADPGRPAGAAGGGGGGGRVSRLGRGRVRHRRDARRQRRDADAMRTRAAVMREPGRLELREVELEEPRAGEVLVRMAAVGVCGTDLHSYKGEWTRPTPIVLGHEGAGIVEAVGDGRRRASRRATASCSPGRLRAASAARAGAGGRRRAARSRPRSGAGRCSTAAPASRSAARPSTAARRREPSPSGSSSRPRRAMPLGDDVPLEQAALLGCAALTGVGAVLNAARPEPGFTALVIGAGGVGQFVVQGARIAGAREILVVDPVEGRREQALALGATRACAPDDVREAVRELDPEGVDFAFDAVGAPATTALALRWTRGGGTAVIVGLPAAGEKLELDPLDFTNREKTLTGTIYGSEDPAVMLPRLLDLVRSGELELASLVGPSFPLDRADDAFQASLAGEPGRVLVTP